ncbi:LysE family translocator [Saccharopolyspora sp. ASAGF58]|uniref:LysE family translocator n=1 Tax=Saccharopolyspora sp. ASAGF58 TaxID=2719023 RepID=UPI00143FDFEB|nr:LysE family translocator [Saccharopolyspora sp. ASAGF58]QIZ36321.1 LysE family translocator [Saccharopolyspora sp. ASAGF58]
MSVEFLLTMLIVVITPGTGVLYTMAAALSRGMAAGVVAAVGCTLGIVPHMIAAISGLAALLSASSVAFEVLRYLGVAYLLYMAWGVLRERGGLKIEDDVEPQSPLRVIVHGILINILNPKLTLFFFAFLPQFVDTNAPNALLYMVELSAVFMLATFVVFVLYGKFAAIIRWRVISKPQILAWLRRVFGIAFIALAARLVFDN